MRIGILSTGTPDSGGVYQYGATMLHALHQYTDDGCQDDFIIYRDQALPSGAARLNGRKWTSQHLPIQPSLPERARAMLRQGIGEGRTLDALRWLRRSVQRDNEIDFDKIRRREDINERFRRDGVHLMLYPDPNPLAFETSVPYVMAIHDLQHRLQPEFPEVSARGEWERREYLFRNGARYATVILADSEVGKEDILNYYEPYGITPDRVMVLPFLPSCYLSRHVSHAERKQVRKTHRLPERYLFYPAQFWPHKNHARIVRALSILKKDHGLDIPIVFCGSHNGLIRKSNFQEVMRVAADLGIDGNIHCRGYVTDRDISALYAEAAALVMPTFFGPTNIPVLEAWAMDCPVLTSDIRGIREQVGNAAILADPHSADSIAEGIYTLWTDSELSRALARRGRQRLAGYTEEDYRRRLIEVLECAKMHHAESKRSAVCG